MGTSESRNVQLTANCPGLDSQSLSFRYQEFRVWKGAFVPDLLICNVRVPFRDSGTSDLLRAVPLRYIGLLISSRVLFNPCPSSEIVRLGACVKLRLMVSEDGLIWNTGPDALFRSY